MTKLETAQQLADAHKAWEPRMRSVYVLEPLDADNRAEPIKLLEVVEGTIERGIEPIAFSADPARGIDYLTYIVEVSPREFADLQQGALSFAPHDWRIGQQLVA